MNKRNSDRLPVNLKANITISNKAYSGLINNVSECGVGYLLVSLDYIADDVAPEKAIIVNFRTPSGLTLSLDCELKWFSKPQASAGRETSALTLGLKIVNPPQQYTEYVKTLQERTTVQRNNVAG